MAEISSPASDPHSLRRQYPHQVQGVSQLLVPKSWTLSHCGSPASFLVENKTRLCEVNDERNCRPSVVDGLQTWNLIVARRLKRLETPYAVRLLLACRRLYVGVENGQPFPILLFPHGSGVVGTRHVLAFVGAFDLHLVRCDDDIFFIGEHVIIADLE